MYVDGQIRHESIDSDKCIHSDNKHERHWLPQEADIEGSGRTRMDMARRSDGSPLLSKPAAPSVLPIAVTRPTRATAESCLD